VADEECDDGNLTDHDGCNHLCKVDTVLSSTSSSAFSTSSYSTSSVVSANPYCGNGRLEGSEECEQGVSGCPSGFTCDRFLCRCAVTSSSTAAIAARPASSSARTVFICGDRIQDPGEECESGLPCPGGAFCTTACRCVQSSFSSEDTWYPAASSSSEFSFSSFAFSSEESFFSFAFSSEESSSSSGPLCGNGVLDDEELCDRNYPCPEGMVCDVDCQCGLFVTQESSSALSLSDSSPTALCGNGIVESTEQCDDGNISFMDGCLSSCAVEPGYACAGEPSNCFPVCGDGIQISPEECDDGNLTDGDGCSSICTIEYAAAPSSSSIPIITSVCGNGIIEEGEQCDDGNTASEDGCTVACTIELIVASSSSIESSVSSVSSESSASSISSSIPMPVTETPTRSPWMLWGLLALIVFVAAFAVAFFLKKLNAVKKGE
jgi:cysteine-rich repeat protein